MSRTQTFENPSADEPNREDRRKLPDSHRRAPFRYIHNAAQWECAYVGDDPAGRKDASQYEMLPVLGRIEGVAGANGVRYDKATDRWNFQAATTAHNDLGNIVIEPSNRQLGRWVNYAGKYYPTQNFRRYIEPGEKWVLMPNGDCFAESDMKEYQQFVRHLKTIGLIEPMEHSIYRVMRRTIEQRITSLQKHGESRKLSIARAEFQLECLDRAWAKERERVRRESALLDTPQAVVEEELEPAPAPAVPTRTARADTPSITNPDDPEAEVPAIVPTGKAKPPPRTQR